MNRLRISPSKLEQFRLHYEGAYNGMVTAERVIESITGVFERTEKMIIGSAYHQLIEFGGDAYRTYPAGSGQAVYRVREEESGEVIEFTEVEARAALNFRAAHPGMVFEEWAELNWGNIRGYEVTMKMRLDGMLGLGLYENKTSHSSRKPTIENYRESMQWRCYMLTFPEAEFIEYNVFWRYYRKYIGHWKVDHFSFRFERQADMYPICREYLGGLIRFAEDRGVIEHLLDRPRN